MLYSGETVRLLRELPEHALPQYAEGKVAGVAPYQEGEPRTLEVRFYKGAAPLTVSLISCLGDRAVWVDAGACAICGSNSIHNLRASRSPRPKCALETHQTQLGFFPQRRRIASRCSGIQPDWLKTAGTRTEERSTWLMT